MIARGHLLILSLLLVLIHAFLFWRHGFRVFQDSTIYLDGADYIIAHGKLQDIHHLYYSVPILIMAGFRWMFPGEIVPIILVQCLLSGLASIALYKSAERLFDSRLAGLFAGVIFLTWLDNIHWNTTTMTESISCSIYCFVVYRVVHWRDKLRDSLVTVILLIVTFFTRPTSVVIIVSLFVFLSAYYWQAVYSKRVVLISVASVGSILILFTAERMLDHWNFSDQYLKGNIITYADGGKDNPLYHESLSIDPPTTTSFAESSSPIGRVVSFMVENPIHFLKAAGLKVFFLVTFVRPYYSWTHNLYLCVWLLLVYMLFVLGWRSTPNCAVNLFVLTAIVLNCGLIAIASVDWDNRFYIPMEPGIVLLAGGGAASLLGRCPGSSQALRPSLPNPKKTS